MQLPQGNRVLHRLAASANRLMGKISAGLMEPIARWDSHWHPMGVMYISSYLEKYGYAVHLLNTKLLGADIYGLGADDLEQLVCGKIAALDLDLLGLSCAVNEINHVASFCGRIKKQFPRLKIMVGGPMPTTMPELFLADGTIDFVVRGEGEETTLELIKSLESGAPLSGVKGLSFRENGAPRHNPGRPLIADINAIPFPAYEKVDMRHYVSMHDWVIRGFPLRGIFFLTSRGCPFDCAFCGASTIHGKKVRFRSPESIRLELKLLRDDYGVEGVFFSDDTFTLNRGHVAAVCAVMKELGLVWGCFARVDTISGDLLRLMKDSGCLQLDFGVESGSDRVLRDIIRKGTTVAQARSAFALCEKTGMRAFANLMIGLPTETAEEMRATYMLGKELNAHAYILSIAMPLPNTDLWKMTDPKISPGEYDRLNWHGDNFDLTDRCNKSAVPTAELIRLHHYYGKQLRNAAISRTLRGYGQYLRVFLRLGHKFERLKFELICRLRQVDFIFKPYLFLKSRFKFVGRLNLFVKSLGSR